MVFNRGQQSVLALVGCCPSGKSHFVFEVRLEWEVASGNNFDMPYFTANDVQDEFDVSRQTAYNAIEE
ncbi:hypothetical protein [Natrinema limicola]|uniref:Filamentation induced by cAMP protein Fic n=1 Tax=Natrinema limicola JCM 13563 TaxID=1230457 RepID=M0C1M3_9EURY|nr:hypothetical protein [Natrinema limicola]ELZ17100.1 filamentation induced by cAMP protein Fic [Natrinema limicola JCM 13563]